MKNKIIILAGLIAFIVVLSVYMGFDFAKSYILYVLIGIVILTLVQIKRGLSLQEKLKIIKKSALFSGIITTLLEMLIYLGSDFKEFNSVVLISKAAPAIFGGLIYTVVSFFIKDEEKRNAFCGDIVQEILYKKGFTPRECHVAMKIFENLSNKEIAQQLYVSESTVKKHIQNMFKKCNASNRQEFVQIYIEWSKEE